MQTWELKQNLNKHETEVKKIKDRLTTQETIIALLADDFLRFVLEETNFMYKELPKDSLVSITKNSLDLFLGKLDNLNIKDLSIYKQAFALIYSQTEKELCKRGLRQVYLHA